jgi:arylsulfatase
MRLMNKLLGGVLLAACFAGTALAADRPNVVVLMTDDVGWSDWGYISGGGAALGHPTPNIDRLAKEGTYFTSWYGQASCTAGRTSFMTGAHPDSHGHVRRRGAG